jgi:hypothetical protein
MKRVKPSGATVQRGTGITWMFTWGRYEGEMEHVREWAAGDLLCVEALYGDNLEPTAQRN